MNKKLLLMGHFDGYGGAQTAFKKLIDFAVEDKFEFKIIAISDFPEKVFSSYSQNTLLGVLPYKRISFFTQIIKMAKLLRICFKAKTYNANIFITVGLNNSSNMVARGLNKNCFKIAQDFIADRDVDDRLWNKSKKVFDGIAVQAPAMLAYWKNYLPGINGINWLPCFPSQPEKNIRRLQKNTNDDTVRICYFGRLAGNKGLDLLIKAFKHSNVPEGLCADLWGNGEESKRLAELIESLNLTHRVRLMGAYPDGRPGAEKLASYDCLILCSTEMEGLPLILLEAMAYGVPIMATDVGAICDCCINNADAILIEPNEYAIADGLAQVYQRVLRNDFDPERQIDYYKENFSYPVMKNRWVQCLENPEAFFDL